MPTAIHETRERMAGKAKSKDASLCISADAAEALGISLAQFRRIVQVRGKSPDGVGQGSRDRVPAHLWSRRTIAALARTKDVAEARVRGTKRAANEADSLARYREETRLQEARDKRFAERLPHKIGAIYGGDPHEALSAACEALFALNRFANDRSNIGREEIHSLKSLFVQRLYEAEVYTDRVERITRYLPGLPCYGCEGSEGDIYDVVPCDRCDGSGWYRAPREVASYAFDFTVEGRRYSWICPDNTIGFVPRVEATRADNGVRHAPEPQALKPRRRQAMLALVRYAMTGIAVADDDGKMISSSLGIDSLA